MNDQVAHSHGHNGPVGSPCLLGPAGAIMGCIYDERGMFVHRSGLLALQPFPDVPPPPRCPSFPPPLPLQGPPTPITQSQKHAPLQITIPVGCSSAERRHIIHQLAISEARSMLLSSGDPPRAGEGGFARGHIRWRESRHL